METRGASRVRHYGARQQAVERVTQVHDESDKPAGECVRLSERQVRRLVGKIQSHQSYVLHEMKWFRLKRFF